MAMNWRRVGVFVGGVVVGAVLAGVLVGQPRKAAPVAASGPAPAAVQQAAAATGTRTVDCSFAPVVTAANKDDGLLPLDKDLQGNSPAAVATLILAGKEAAAAGKPRDAEAAFLMACRSAENVKNDPIPLADAQYQLGRHYAQVAAPPDLPQRAELLRRAEALYASSLRAYLKHRGASHEKTRFAQEGLDALHRLTGAPAPAVTAVPGAEENARAAASTRVAGAAPQPAAPVVAPPVVTAPPVTAPEVSSPPVAVAPAARPEPPKAAEAVKAPEPQKPAEVATAAPERKPEPKKEVKTEAKRAGAGESAPVAAALSTAPLPRQARRASPSFDCARARSTNEKLICEDEELARQDRELGRLHQRARQAAADRRAFERESDAEWQRREETCRGDRECLQRWYARRRAELSAAAERPAAPAPTRAARPAPAPAAPAPAPRAAAPEPAPAPVPRAAPEPAPIVVAPDPAPPEPPVEVISEPPATASGNTAAPIEPAE